MSQAEELLNSLSESVVEHEHPVVDTDTYFVIDPVSRVVSNETQQTIVLMQNDHLSERFTFEIPRYVEGHDMTLCNSVLVHWINVDAKTEEKRAEASVITDLQVNPDNKDTVTCSWLISRNSTQLVGGLSFLVQYKCVADDGTVTYEWHSDIFTDVIIKATMSNSEQSVSDYTDVYEQWRTQLFGAGDSVISDIKSTSAEEQAKLLSTSESQQSAIEAKGSETLDSIPDDYSELYGMAKEALRTRANAMVKTAEGNPIIVNDASDDYARGLRIFGKSTQVSTTGKQLIRTTAVSHVNNGGTIIVNDDGTISLIGTFSQNTAIAIGKTTANGELVLSGGVESSDINNSYMYVSMPDGSNIGWYGKDKTFTNDGTERGVYLVIIAGTYRNVTIKPMIRFSSIEDGSYEPYSEGVVSPSPDFPQPITNVTNPTIQVLGKNLLNPNRATYTDRGVTLTNNGDGSYSVKGTSTAAVGIELANLNKYSINLYKGVTYTQSIEILSGTKPAGALVVPAVKDAFGNTLYNYLTDNQTKTSATDYTMYSYTLYLSPDVTVDFTFRVQLEVGDKATEWKAYTPPQNITPVTATTLPGIPVSTGGNYVDPNGQRWICDEIDFERGVYIQRTKVINMADYSDWHSWGVNYRVEGYTGFHHYWEGLGNDCTNIMCSIAPHKGDLWGGSGFGAWTTKDGNQYVAISIPNSWLSNISTKEAAIESFKELCANTNAQMIMTLAPIETPLTDEDLYNFSQLRSKYPKTVVLNTSGANMEIKYNADTALCFNGFNGVTSEQIRTEVQAYFKDNPIDTEALNLLSRDDIPEIAEQAAALVDTALLSIIGEVSE